MENKITKVKKRNGEIVRFDQEKVTKAIYKAITSTGQGDGVKSKKVSAKVIEILNRRFKEKEIPQVEQIQDIVEEMLILEGLVETAKAYILYREQRRRIRESKVLDESTEKIDKYLKELDWQIYENANMTFSLQGLNQYAISDVSKKYWLNKVYPERIRKAAAEEDFHIHDLNSLSTYCCGWDLYDLLKKGFGGVPGKLECRPPKHLGTALGQLVNFFFTLQGECYSEDTQVLTESGWKYFYEVDEEDKVFTLNNENDQIELQKPVKFYKFDHNGPLYNFKSKKLDLLVTPNHNMVVDQYCPKHKGRLYQRKFVKAKDLNPNIHFIPKRGNWKGQEEKTHRIFSLEKASLSQIKIRELVAVGPNSGEEFTLPEIEISYYKSSGQSCEAVKAEAKKIPIEDWLKFFGFWLAEGSLYKRKGRSKLYYEYHVRIAQNEGKIAEEFEKVLKRLPFHYSKKRKEGKIEWVISSKQLFSYLKSLKGSGNKFIPEEIKKLDKRFLAILFDWMTKGDDYIDNGNVEFSTKSKKLADDFQEITLKLGFSADIYQRTKKQFNWYDVSVSRSAHFRFTKENIKKVSYQGKVYCLEVPNHTLYVRRKGKACWCGNSAGAQAVSNFDTLLAPFVRYDGLSYPHVKQAMQEFLYNCMVPTRTGFQTPFVNVTLDINPPSYLADQPVIIGGKTQEETYGDFQEEMNMIIKAFYEGLMEGDAKGRPFSVDSDSLCPIKNSEKIKLVKIGEYIDNLMRKSKPMYVRENNCQVLDVKDLNIKSLGLKDGKISWQKVNFLVRHPLDSLLKIESQGGFSVKVTPSHSVLVLRDGKIKNFEAGSLKSGDHLVMPKTFPQGENKVLKISLAEEFLKRKKGKGIYIRTCPKNVLENNKAYTEKKTRPCDSSSYKVLVFPLLDIKEKLDELDLSRSKLSLRGSAFKIPNCLPVTGGLMEFLGWYCAEGSAEKNKRCGGVSLSFNLKKEKKQAQRVAKLAEKIFRTPSKIREIKNRNLIEVRIHSKLVRRIITEIFEIKKGKERKVPQVIFELSPKMKKIFLQSYFKGDAWITKDIIATSISRELIYGVSTLLKQLNVFHTLEEYTWKGRKRWRVSIWQNQKLEAKDSHSISKIPIKESGLGGIIDEILKKEHCFHDSLGRKYKNSKNRIFQKFGVSHQSSVSPEKAEKIIKYAKKLKIKIPSVFEDTKELSFLRVKKIKQVPSSNGMVYDFSTESENFVADQLLVHNTFPIPTVSITRDFNWSNPALESMWEATAKYGVNYFSNFVNSDMNPEDARSMCCRLRLDNKELIMRGGGLFGSNPLTGSVGVVTINLPRMGYLSKTKKEFFKRLKELMELAKESLEIKRKALDNFAEKGLYPYSRVYLDPVKKIRGSYFGNHFSTIGLMGMNEALRNFLAEDMTTSKGKKFALEVLDFMRDKLVDFQKETGNLYNLEATPAEGTSYRQAKIDKEKYPDIITAGTKEKPYYTNSSQLPVGFTDDVFEAFKLQDEVQCRYTGGTVLHGFLGERINDPEMAKALVKKIAEKFHLPYFTLTPTFSICPTHGYISGEHFYCPKCAIEQPCEVYSRIVGYIRPVQQWNTGKKQEFKERKEFKVKEVSKKKSQQKKILS